MTNWEQKLAAFLHDPPEKGYDYGPAHVERARNYASLILGHSAWRDHDPDHSAAAADRFIFPDGRKPVIPDLGEGVVFRHPFTGELAFEERSFPEKGDAESAISSGIPDFQLPDLKARFWLLWRLWLHQSVVHPDGQQQGAATLAYLPADTRIPDGSIWHHNSIVSALEGTRDANGKLKPALMLFQIGPVQDFIAQARSTRDLWSGSYLISWMMAYALKTLTDELGPDAVVFPSLRGQPLYDWLHKDLLLKAAHRQGGKDSKDFWEANGMGKEQHQELILTPNLPNRFLAIVPADFDPKAVANVFEYEDTKSEWRRIADTCLSFLKKCGCPIQGKALDAWKFQILNFWQITWQIWPWQEVPDAIKSVELIPRPAQPSLADAYKVATSIPVEHLDARCYQNKSHKDQHGKWQTEIIPEPNGRPVVRKAGWAWSAHYQLVAHRLDARRQTRDFKAWSGQQQTHKDHFSGKEEVVASEEWLKIAQEKLPHLFRGKDELGAVNLIKRVWHKAYLGGVQKLNRARTAFDSVPAVAAAPWRDRILLSLRESEAGWSELLDFWTAVKAADGLLDFSLPAAGTEGKWFERVDASVFHESFWRGLEAEGENVSRIKSAEDALRAFLRATDKGRPSRYYAVLALDGDNMGKWLAGENSPPVRDVMSRAAAKYFENTEYFPDAIENNRRWLNSSRPISPSFHLQFSEALANFALYAARRIVEHHHGQLIYAGGDDVLAMLPADEALACARGLSLAFKGSPELWSNGSIYHHIFDDCPKGFVRLKDGGWASGARQPGEPSWPLLVPGEHASVSVGIAIGHIKEPLQDMVREAQAAERRAKAKPMRRVLDRQTGQERDTLSDGWAGNAVAVTLFKRSGETIRWGTRFGSKAFELLRFLHQKYRGPIDEPEKKMSISGRFPYRLIEILSRYDARQPLTDDLVAIANADFAYVVEQQASGLDNAEKAEIRDVVSAYLEELRTFSWRDEGNDRVSPRSLSEFYNLLAVEAFVSRSGEE